MWFTTADKSSVRTDIEGNISAYYQSAKLLDESYGSGAEAAYSVRQLKRDNTECMVIRRASDSTTTTIGFDGSGNIDEAAITKRSARARLARSTNGLTKAETGTQRQAAAPTNEPTILHGWRVGEGEMVKVALVQQTADKFFTASYTGASTSTIVAVSFISNGVSKSCLLSSGTPQFLVAEDGDI